jgi:hypothetical protein
VSPYQLSCPAKTSQRPVTPETNGADTNLKPKSKTNSGDNVKRMFWVVALALTLTGAAASTASADYMQTHSSAIKAVKEEALTRYGATRVLADCSPVSLADYRNRAHVWTCGWQSRRIGCRGGMRIYGRPDSSPWYNQYRARVFVYACDL